jgi:NDMA-dependent alcohol dehydrogenase
LGSGFVEDHMKISAAVVHRIGEPWSVEEVELDPPTRNEVLVEIAASGLCRTDEHCRVGDISIPLPVIGGHEGAGRVVEVGDDVSKVNVGDHVVLGTIPCCGKCRWCLSGKAYLCDMGAYAVKGFTYDGTYRQRIGDVEVGKFVQLGTFASHAVVNEMQVFAVDKDIPLEVAALVGCGVATGWGSAVNVAEVEVGETVVVCGLGGVGMSAVQGARNAGAVNIVAIDPIEFRRGEATTRFGAHYSAASIAEGIELVRDITLGVMAEKVIISVGLLRGEDLNAMVQLVSKGGRVVVTSCAPMGDMDVKLGLFEFAMSSKQLVGNNFGWNVGSRDYKRLFDLYRRGALLIDEMIGQRYALDDINRGYKDMLTGTIVRGVITF